MSTFYPRRARTVVCASDGCTQPIADARAAQGYRRCSLCVEKFATSVPDKPRAAAPAQGNLLAPPLKRKVDALQPARVLVRGQAADRVVAPAGGIHGGAPIGPVRPLRDEGPAPRAERPDAAIAATARKVRELVAAAIPHDKQTKRMNQLLADGVSHEQAILIIDAEERGHDA